VTGFPGLCRFDQQNIKKQKLPPADGKNVIQAKPTAKISKCC